MNKKKSFSMSSNLVRALDEQQVFHYDLYDCELMMELAVSVTNFQCSHAASQLNIA